MTNKITTLLTDQVNNQSDTTDVTQLALTRLKMTTAQVVETVNKLMTFANLSLL